MSFCTSLQNFIQIEPTRRSCHIDFWRWRPTAMTDLSWVIADHPRCLIVSLSLVIKFGLDRTYNFGDIAIFILRRCGLKLPITCPFWGFWGHFPQMTPSIVLTSKRTVPAWKHVVWVMKGENRSIGLAYAQDQEKCEDSRKNRHFLLWKPHCADWKKLHGG